MTKPANPSTDRKPCPPWCGGEHPLYRLPGPVWCSTDCKDAGPPLNRGAANPPASPSTEAPACGNCDVGFPLEGDYHYGTQRLGMIPFTPCAKVPHPAPRPIERCSCAESIRLREALEKLEAIAIREAERMWPVGVVAEEMASIARRALALEPDGK